MVECMSPGVNGMGTIRDVYVVVSNDDGTEWSTSADDQTFVGDFAGSRLFRYSDCSPRVSTAEGSGLEGAHDAGSMQQITVIGYDANSNNVDNEEWALSGQERRMQGGGDAFYLEVTPNPRYTLVSGELIYDDTYVEVADLEEEEEVFEFYQNRNDHQNGMHVLTYNITVAGTYDLRVLLGGVPVQSAYDVALLSDVTPNQAGGEVTITQFPASSRCGQNAVNCAFRGFQYSGIAGEDYYTYRITIVAGESVGHQAIASGAGWDAWYIWNMPIKGSFIVQARDIYGNARTTDGDTVTVRFYYNESLPLTDSTEEVDSRSQADGGVLQHSNEYSGGETGTYNVTYETQRAGLYYVQVEMCTPTCAPISNSGHTLTVYPDISTPLNSFGRITCGADGCVAGQDVTLSITSADEYDNMAVLGNCLYQVEFSVVGYIQATPFQAALAQTAQVAPTDNEDGSYTVVYTPTLSGDYSVDVKLCEDELGAAPCWREFDAQGQPYGVCGCRRIGRFGLLNATIVAAEPFGGNTIAYGDSKAINPNACGAECPLYVARNALGYAQSGYAFEFTVEARDIYNNRINVGGDEITGSVYHTLFNQNTPFTNRTDPCSDLEDAECAVYGDNGDGTYRLTYRVTLSGTYKLNVRIDGLGISTVGNIEGRDDLNNRWFILDVDAAAAFAPFTEIGSVPSQSGRSPPLRVPALVGDHECTPLPNCLGYAIAGETKQMQIAAFDRFGNQRTTGGDYMNLVFKPIEKWNGDIDAGPPSLIYLPEDAECTGNNAYGSCPPQFEAAEDALPELERNGAESSCPAGCNYQRAAPAFSPGLQKTDHENGLYTLAYTLTKTGDYLIEVNVNNLTYTHPATGLFPFNVGPASPFPGTSRANVEHLYAERGPITAGYWTTFIITSYDRFENLVPYGGRNMTAEFMPLDENSMEIVNFGPDEVDGGGTFEEQHFFPTGTAEPGSGFATPFEVTDFMSGLYMINYTFYVKSKVRISLFMDAQSIFGSPYDTHCQPGPLVIDNCQAVNTVQQPTATTEGIAGTEYLFTIWSRDLYGNKLTYGELAPAICHHVTCAIHHATLVLSPRPIHGFAGKGEPALIFARARLISHARDACDRQRRVRSRSHH